MLRTNQQRGYTNENHHDLMHFPNTEKENERPIQNQVKRKSKKRLEKVAISPASSSTASKSPLSSLTSCKPLPYSSIQETKLMKYHNQRRYGSNLTAETSVITEDSSSGISSLHVERRKSLERDLESNHEINSNHSIGDNDVGFESNLSFDLVEVESVESVESDQSVEEIDSKSNESLRINEDDSEHSKVKDLSSVESTRSEEQESNRPNQMMKKQSNMNESSRTMYHDPINYYDGEESAIQQTLHSIHQSEIDNESFVTATSRHNFELHQIESTYHHRLIDRQASLDIPSHIISSAQYGNNRDDNEKKSPKYAQLASSRMSSLSSMQWDNNSSQRHMYEDWMPEKKDFHVTHHDNGSLVTSASLQSTPPDHVSRQRSLDIPSCLISSVKCSDLNSSLFNCESQHPEESTCIKNGSTLEQSKIGIFDVLKQFFSIESKKGGMNNMMTPSPKVVAKKSNVFCAFPTNMCTESVESPITPEYEKECKRIIERSAKPLMTPYISKKHGHSNQNDVDATSSNQAFLKTVKKKNGIKLNDNPAFAKTVKKKNTLTPRRESYLIADETVENSHTINVYEANSKTENLIKSKECFFSGFDGKQNHYTYVSPKKDDGLPTELKNSFITNHEYPTQISSSVPLEERKKLHFQSPGTKEATTVVHVVSPKSTNHKGDKNTEKENMMNGQSFDTSSNSMQSGERRIVNGFLQNATTWVFQNNDGITKHKKRSPYNEKSPYENSKSIKRDYQAHFERNVEVDDQTVQTYGTMGTNGTMHRRTNSTSTFTANSLAQIFDVRSPLQERQLNISPSFQVVPYTISKIAQSYRHPDDESLISPLGDDVNDENSVFNFDNELNKDIFYQWKNHVKIAEKAVLPSEPDGVYMPKSKIFKESLDKRQGSCCLEGWLAFSKGSRLLDALENDEGSISRKDLRYVMIENNLLHVYTSKKNKNELDTSLIDPDVSMDYQNTNKSSSDKVLKLSRDMKVEMKFISKRHGHCVCVIDRNTAKVACTLLPVRLSPSFFRDEEYSQVICSKKFKKLRDNLIGLDMSNDTNQCGVVDESKSKSETKSDEWPLYMPQIAPEEQNTTAICLQFALDTATYLDYSI